MTIQFCKVDIPTREDLLLISQHLLKRIGYFLVMMWWGLQVEAYYIQIPVKALAELWVNSLFPKEDIDSNNL